MTDFDATDAAHLRRALALAGEAGARGDGRFGAVAVGTDGAVIAEGINSTVTLDNPTAHAEIMAITAACEEGGGVRGATLYVSGEPCPMCATAMVWAGIARIVFGASSEELCAVQELTPVFDLTCAELIATSAIPVEVSGPHLGAEALQVFRDGPPP